MWRKFLGFGIPIMLVGAVLWVEGAAGDGGTLLSFGYILSIIGAMFIHAGLIGAAVGADPRTQSASQEVESPASLSAAEHLLESANEMLSRVRLKDAIFDLKRAIELKPDFFPAEYKLACIYSQLRDKDEAYGWLTSAIGHGLDDFQMVEADPDLEFLRSQPEFADLVGKHYK